VFKAHRLSYHSTLGLRVIKKKGPRQFRPPGTETFRLPYYEKTQGWLAETDEGVISEGGRGGLRGGTHDKKISKDHLPRVVYQKVYNVYEDKAPIGPGCCSNDECGVRCMVVPREEGRGSERRRKNDGQGVEG